MHHSTHVDDLSLSKYLLANSLSFEVKISIKNIKLFISLNLKSNNTKK